MPRSNNSKDLLTSKKLLQGKRVFFAHQSVGADLIKTINKMFTIANLSPPKIQEIDLESDIPDQGILHMIIGENRRPLSKIQEFEKTLNSNKLPTPDIAALKLCYVDILGQETPEEIFTAYDEMTSRIKRNHPSLILIHFTMPLMAKQTILEKLRSLITGSPLTRNSENILRCRFNQLINNRYQNNEIVFDIAKLESTSPKKTTCTFKSQRIAYSCLCRIYTTDGGHLNTMGNLKIAKSFLTLITSIFSKSNTQYL